MGNPHRRDALRLPVQEIQHGKRRVGFLQGLRWSYQVRRKRRTVAHTLRSVKRYWSRKVRNGLENRCKQRAFRTDRRRAIFSTIQGWLYPTAGLSPLRRSQRQERGMTDGHRSPL